MTAARDVQPAVVNNPLELSVFSRVYEPTMQFVTTFVTIETVGPNVITG